MTSKDDPLLEGGARQRKLTSPGFVLPMESPVPDADEWKALGFRDRCREWSLAYMYQNAAFPIPTVLIIYICFFFMWWSGWRYLFMHTVHPQTNAQCKEFWCGLDTLYTNRNMRKFILYNILHGVLGFGATCGSLGFRFLIPFGTGLQLVTPGSISAPLFPGIVGKFNCCFGKKAAQRSSINLFLYFGYVGTLIRALRFDGDIGTDQLYPIYGFYIVGTIWDVTIFNASRGDHYGYMLLALMFPDWLQGCQMVQIALWMWAGVSKIGPWFNQVLPFLLKESVFSPILPEGTLAKYLYSGLPNECGPSALAKTLAFLGTTLELILPLLLFVPNQPLLNQIGCYGMCCYHVVIICCCPFASVFEWNYFCIFISMFMFRYANFDADGNSPANNPVHLPTSTGLQCLLLFTSVLIPMVGQAVPTLVPFLMAYRPYMGNWRMSWIVVHKNALHKHDKLKVWASPFEVEQAKPYAKFLREKGWQGGAFMEQVHYFVLGILIFAPSFRLVVPIMEKLLEKNGWHIDDVVFGFGETWQNQVFGWSLGTGWLQTRECFREAVVDCCGFKEKEMYCIQLEPASPFNLKVFYRCMDIVRGPEDNAPDSTLIHGSVAFERLTGKGSFTDIKLTDEEMKVGGKSIRGKFLDTYYTY